MSGDSDRDDDQFLLEEEEYHEDGECKEAPNIQPRDWSSVVIDVCNSGVAGEEETDGVMLESDLDSLCSDDDQQTRKKSRRAFNPHSNLDDFKFRLGMEFTTIVHLRDVLKEVFIRDNREFKYVVNDRTRLRAKCKGKGCKWLILCEVAELGHQDGSSEYADRQT